MVEIAVDEILLKPSVRRSVLHDYGEPFELLVPVYSLEEILAEWKQWLGPLVPKLPPYRSVIEELRPQVTALLASRG